MLEARGLVVSIDGARVLDGIDLHVATGETVAILGAAGSGKTVLTRTLCGLSAPAAGRIGFGDQDIAASGHAAAVEAGLIHVPQAGLVFPNLPVRDNLLLGATLRGRMGRQDRLAAVLEMLPRLRPVIERLAGTLDRGTRQLVAIGRGLMGVPHLLVLDEPGAPLDDASRTELARLVERLGGLGMSILMTGRTMAPPLTVASRVGVLEGGRILGQGS